MVTSGAVHGLRLVLGTVLSPGDRVIVESPSYPLALDAIRSAGGRAVPVPIEAGGWDLGAFAEAARATGARTAYLMPDFHNPTGRLMDAQTRSALAAALARADCTIVVDETMADLDLRGSSAPAAPPPFATCAPRGAVVSLGSASKTFWGGLRLGWVRGDAALVRRLTARRATEDLGSPLVEQLATTHLLADVDTVLAARRAALATRAAGLVAALARELPSWAAPMPPGGLFLWCRLPSSSSTALAAAARSVGVVLTPGPRFGVDGTFESRLRLPFSRPLPELEAAVARIAPLWRGLTDGLGEPDDDLLVV
jgi:DNA-binding transcriptional MocR family regulator